MKKQRPPQVGKKRHWVRQIETRSMSSKRFTRVEKTPKQVSALRVHPVTVCADLRNGCLESLDEYLRQERGIPDREVALEIRRLISGSILRSQYRIIVIEHPDRPKRKVGRRSRDGRPSDLAFTVATEFRNGKKKGQVEALAEELAEKHEIKVDTVYQYVRRVGKYEASMSSATADKSQTPRASLTWSQYLALLAASLKKNR